MAALAAAQSAATTPKSRVNPSSASARLLDAPRAANSIDDPMKGRQPEEHRDEGSLFYDKNTYETQPMKFIRYGKYVGEPADAIDLEELIKRLGDFFLQRGFESQFYGVNEMDPEKSREALRQAILHALQQGDLLPEGAVIEAVRQMRQSD